MARRHQDFQTIKSEGGLLPPDLLRRLVNPRDKLEGTDPKDYGLAPGERLNDAITQSWSKLRKHWADFRKSAQGLPDGEPGTSLTNEKWSVPLLRELGFGMLPTSAAPVVDGKSYAINRFFGATAVHLIGCQLDLDRRAKGVRGAAMANPHGLVQDFLNRSDAHLWAILSNGLRLRVLRDSQAISRQSYLEFDLEAMFDGEAYADFVVLWMVAHSTRFAARESVRPDSCWLERWTKLAEEQGTRALGDLRHGVEKALEILGQGFVGHPKNAALRESLRTGKLPLTDFHGQLLRIVYRLIFLFVAEDRTLEGLPLLHPRDESDAAQIARERYATNYSAGRLREMANEIRGSRHGDLWWQLNLVFGALSDDDRFTAVRKQLALPVLGSFLWSPDSTAALNAPSLAANAGTALTNADLLEAIWNLAFTRQNHSLRPVDYKNLGAEELGGVYESLLALTPQISGDGAKLTFAEFAGNERKTSGSYYTPDSLVQCLLDSALEPVIEEALKGKRGAEAEKAILTLKVCDPAVGSGHFLVRAAHRLARHLARIQAEAQGEGEPSPGFYQHALRDVIGRCMYGVDINPMAAELCRVSLWLEALDPGKPLSFLDHHIRVGNSLLGTTPRLIADGVPDDAFTPIEGDDKHVCAQLKKRNKAERQGFDQLDLRNTESRSVAGDLVAIAKAVGSLNDTPDDTADAVRHKSEEFGRLVVSTGFKHAKLVADAWCASFVCPKTIATLSNVISTSILKQLDLNPDVLTPSQHIDVETLSEKYHFFHWHLAFPEVFAKEGFDCVLGNPPWERIQPEATEFFAASHPELSSLKREERNNAIAALALSDPSLHFIWCERRREDLNVTRFLKKSGRFPLSTNKNVNSYAVFQEQALSSLAPIGISGMILQGGIATDEINGVLFRSMIESDSLTSLIEFENLERLFPDVDSRMRFSLLTCRGSRVEKRTTPVFAFGLVHIDDIRDEERLFNLTIADLRLISPNTGLCPTFRSRKDARLLQGIYRRIGPFIRDGAADGNPWGASISRLFSMGYDSGSFVADARNNGTAELAKVYEGKLIHQFDHRFAEYTSFGGTETATEYVGEDKHREPFGISPRFWAADVELSRRMRKHNWGGKFLFGYRDIARSSDERTCISSVLPWAAPDDTIRVIFTSQGAKENGSLVAILNSFVFDFAVRNVVASTHLSEYLAKQFPVLSPVRLHRGLWLRGVSQAQLTDWFAVRVLELSYTAWDLEPFAQDCGFDGPPFRWDEDRRFLLRAELDAAFFHLYLPSDSNGDWVKAESESDADVNRLKDSFSAPRDAVDYIMETFPIVKKKDIEKYGNYRTQLQILEIYDEMQDAMANGTEYTTKLDPPPGDLRCCHPYRDALSS